MIANIRHGLALLDAHENDGEQDWTKDAKCARSADPEMWYAPLEVDAPRYRDLNKGERERARRADRNRAKEKCLVCPVRTECLKYALDDGQDYGIWGGLTPDERTKLKNMRAARAAAEREEVTS
jgi:WhiB family redox-sensing transcriptional regulator